MGKSERDKKKIIFVDSGRKEKIITFLRKIEVIPHSERLKYLQTITDEEVLILGEIAHNILHGSLNVDYRSFKLLSKVKKFLRDLGDKCKSKAFKKKILKTIQGLNIIAIIVPLTLQNLT